jgi:hypothetical protein
MRSRAVATCVVALAVACGASPNDDPANATHPGLTDDGKDGGSGPTGKPVAALAPCTSDPNDLRRFAECADGGGIYGTWILDKYGMPAFRYELDERNDPRGVRPNSEDIFPLYKKRTDHFHVMGNDRVKLVAVDDGYVTLFGDERGPTFMNRFAEDQQNLGGGFSYVKDGADVWSSMYKHAPASAKTTRVFGMGYFETETEVSGLLVRHTIHAPAGDAALLVDDVVVKNTTSAMKSVQHYEYWDVNRHQLKSDWVRTGLAAAPSDAARDRLNDSFDQDVAWDASKKTLTATMTGRGSHPPPSAVSDVDWYPSPVYLTALAGDVASVYTDQASFFGGDVTKPDVVVRGDVAGGALSQRSASGQPATLVMRSDLALDPGAEKQLRFAYGYVPSGVAPGAASAYAAAKDPLADSLAQWKDRIGYVHVPDAKYLHRETAWRTQALLAATVKNDYYGTQYTAQGSAYLYVHGADGVPRDQSLFAMATTYLDPQIAKGTLRQVMSVTDANTGQIAYSFTNVGMTEGATIHNQPSDIDIFFLLGLAEYLGATGDYAFLDEDVEFYPRGASALPPGARGKTVLDHARAALSHLRDAVGVGDHGLVRIMDGDWDDGIILADKSPTAISNTQKWGESVPNSQMAVVALPLAANALEAKDAALAAGMRAHAAALEPKLAAAFGTRWFGRAWMHNTINQEYLLHGDDDQDPYRAFGIDLQAQPWGLLAGVLDDTKSNRLLDEVESRLDTRSPAMGPRLGEGDAVWPAISQLMTWAYARKRPASAWRSLDDQTYVAHARAFPGSWVGILSAPDGLAPDGGTWSSPVTPMQDFPVANMNPEAMWLVGLLRTAGVEPLGDGLLIEPRHAQNRESYVIDLPLLRIEVDRDRIAGEYRAKNAGSTTLVVGIGGTTAKAKLRGAPAATTITNGRVALPITFAAGERIAFQVTR